MDLFGSPVHLAVGTVVLVSATIALGLASRRRRAGSSPWTTVPLFAAALMGLPEWQLGAVALAALIVEIPGQIQYAPSVVTAVGAALLANRWVSPEVPAPALLFLLYLLTPLPTRLVQRIGGVRGVRPPCSIGEEAAAGVALFGAALLSAAGLRHQAPSLLVTGLVSPLAIPLLLEGESRRRAQRAACETMAEAVASVAGVARVEPVASLDVVAEELGRLLGPLFEPRLTALGISPLFAGPGPSFGIHPRQTPHRFAVRATLQRFLRPGSDSRLDRIVETRPGDLLHPDPELDRGLLIPVWREGHLAAVVATAGKGALEEQVQAVVADAVSTLVDHILRDLELTRRRDELERRVATQSDRLRRLLIMSQAIQTAPDLRTVATNLVRATRVSFDLAWTGLLLDSRGEGVFRLTARSGLAELSGERQEAEGITRHQLQDMLREGRRVSRAIVTPARRWPFPLPHDESEHLIVLPVGGNSDPSAYLLMATHATNPMLELEDLQGLEILTEQAAPMISAALRYEELRRETMLDALTGIPNRRSLDQSMDRILQQADLRNEPVAVAMLDLDDFKLINDRYGHSVGDEVLTELAKLLTRGLRAGDFVARYGGEEFCVVMPGTTTHQAAIVLDRIRHTVAGHPFAAGESSSPLTLTVSVGVAGSPEDGTAARFLLERADVALYAAKRLGKNRVVTTAELVHDLSLPDGDVFL